MQFNPSKCHALSAIKRSHCQSFATSIYMNSTVLCSSQSKARSILAWLYPATCHGFPVSSQSARRQIINLNLDLSTEIWGVHLTANVERVVADQVFLRCSICRSIPEIFAIKVDSCQKLGLNLDVLLALPNFWGRVLPLRWSTSSGEVSWRYSHQPRSYWGS